MKACKPSEKKRRSVLSKGCFRKVCCYDPQPEYTPLSVGLALSRGLPLACRVSGCLANPTGVYVYSGCSDFLIN